MSGIVGVSKGSHNRHQFVLAPERCGIKGTVLYYPGNVLTLSFHREMHQLRCVLVKLVQI